MSCPECFKVFKTRRHLYCHTRQVHLRHNPLPVLCKVCQMSFQTKHLMKEHMRLTHMDEQGFYKCDLCGKSYSVLLKLCNHIERIHQKIRKYICDECDKGFNGNKDLEEHYRVEHGGFRYTCEHCKKEFKNKYAHRDHVQQHEAPKEFRCNICNKSLSARAALHTHRLVHKDELDICNVCGKGVKCMKSHMLSHAEKKQHECEFCQKKFAWRTSLVVHMRTHTGEKPYACEFCDKTFAQRPAIIAHRRHHTGERPYQCQVCQKHFVTSTVRKGHKCKGPSD
ncbi:unnamed protein product [Acanthoscelides obtectus]|uniref:C2H2-type domain-containing protein n=1 Tax=Acanthoscelides obtectus TaxID=200917 RepID=A0A9P0LNC6_ACAOB|nr:unnamed protein product [Acanthoscelides obtectus]CAK1675648.1 Zinc finger protein 227 [Acanthoscelides obtectus]